MIKNRNKFLKRNTLYNKIIEILIQFTQNQKKKRKEIKILY